MSIQTKIFGLAAVAVLSAGMIASPTAVFAASDSTVVAIVDGDKIVKKDVMSAIKNLPIQQGDAEAEKVFPLVLDQIVNEKLIDKATAAAKLEQTEEYKKRVEILKASLLKQMYIEKFLKDKITDSKVKAEYDKFKSDNTGKEEIHARHILVPTEEEAKQVIKDLDGGAKFDELAKKRSSGPTAQNGGDIGYFAKDDMLPEFSNAAFALSKGSYSKTPVKTPFGYHVIKIEDKRKRTVPAMKEVENAIRNKLGQDALEKLVRDLRAGSEIKIFDINGKPVEAPKAN
jgi:peptidyl-prolyl cis-trans isomerase C